MNPDLAGSASKLLASFLSSYYGLATQELGFRRWGFKEVRYDASVAFALLSAFPHARIIFLVRDLNGVLASNAANDWYGSVGGAKGVTARWTKNVRSFLSFNDERVLRVAYFKLASADGETFRSITSHVGLSAPIDKKLLEHKVRAAENEPRTGEEEVDCLRRRDVILLTRRLKSLELIAND